MNGNGKRGRLRPNTQVIVKDPGPNYGRPARIEGISAPGNGVGYWVRFEGEDGIRSALSVEAAQ